jgi:DNA-binding transcriptional LysR family regulator
MSGTVRLTCSTAVAHRLMRSELIDAFHKRYPAIKVELLMTERVLDLSKGEADVAIRGGEAREEALVGKRIGDVPWAVYASQSYVARNGTPRTPEDINDHGIIEFIGEIAALAAARWLPSKAPQARVSGQASNVPSVLLAVKSGVGLVPLPAPLADMDQDLVRVIGAIPELDYPTYLFTHRDEMILSYLIASPPDGAVDFSKMPAAGTANIYSHGDLGTSRRDRLRYRSPVHQ